MMKRPDNVQFSGIEALLTLDALERHERFVPLDRAGRIKWARHGEIEVWQAVALHSFLDPDALGASSEDALGYLAAVRDMFLRTDRHIRRPRAAPSMLGVTENLRIAVTHLAADGPLKGRDMHGIMERTIVSVADFHAWSVRFCLPVYGDWLPTYPAKKPEPPRWSWGAHSTPLLEALEAAAKAHWLRVDEGGRYDPADPTSASTNDKVAAWIREKFPAVSNETALVMARILRDPNLPAGRPRER